MADTMPDPSASLRASGSPWPRISIVTPSYNQGQFLEETIRSVLLQGYPNLEYIIIDGGSTDNSVEIIRKYEPWLTYWVSEKDRGQSHAINKGFAKATGHWLTWLNSDDGFAPDALVNLMKAAGQANANFACGGVIMFGAAKYPVQHVPLPEAFELETLSLMMAFCQPAAIWSRQLYEEQGPLDEKLTYGFDWRFFIRCAPHIRLALIRDVVAFDRSHDARKSIAGGRNRRQEYLEIYDDYLPVQYRGPYKRLKRRLRLMWRLSDLQQASRYVPRLGLAERAILRSIRRDRSQHPYILNMLSIANRKAQFPREVYSPRNYAPSLAGILDSFADAERIG